MKLVIKNSLYIGKTGVLSWEGMDTLWYNKFLFSRAVLVRKSISWQTCMCYKICPQYVMAYAFNQFCLKGRQLLCIGKYQTPEKLQTFLCGTSSPCFNVNSDTMYVWFVFLTTCECLVILCNCVITL